MERYIVYGMQAKTERNSEILALWRGKKSIYWIAKKYGLSWPRTKRIIQEQEKREK